jgi:hypothetical protein
LRPTPYGESFDVLLTTVTPEVLSAYPIILLAGDIEFDRAFLNALTHALRRGSRVLMSVHHKKALATQLEFLKRQGRIDELETWVYPETGRGTAISNQELRRVTQEFQPIEIEGDAIEYQINRTARGWVVELINNTGVIKKPDEPALIAPRAVSRVRLKPKNRCLSAIEWHSGRTYKTPKQIEATVSAGSSEFVEFIEH